jgi:hypothetical protein
LTSSSEGRDRAVAWLAILALGGGAENDGR